MCVLVHTAAPLAMIAALALAASPTQAAPSWTSEATPADTTVIAPAPDELLLAVTRAKNGRSLSRVSAGLKGDFNIPIAFAGLEESEDLSIPLDTPVVLSRSVDSLHRFETPRDEGFQNSMREISTPLIAANVGTLAFAGTRGPMPFTEVQPAALPLPAPALAALPTLAIAWLARRRLTAGR